MLKYHLKILLYKLVGRFGFPVRDERSKECIARVFPFFWKGRLGLIGLPNYRPLAVKFHRLERPIQKLAFLTFFASPEPDYPSIAHEQNSHRDPDSSVT